MHCMLQHPFPGVLTAGDARVSARALPVPGPARPAQSAIYHRRLTAQAPFLGHRPVVARLSKIP